MVKALHGAGLEVILDVVYNHTAEGNHLGPTLSMRGLDNPTYYWLDERDRAHNRDFTGCGNSLRLQHLEVLKLTLDSLRYWVAEMHVDGFRFDLATTLARIGDGGFSREAPFLQVVHQDPVLSRVKLIAEPWDVGDGGYRLANFPGPWAEWNDRYRETVRKYWRGDERQAAEVGYRLTGSSDLFRGVGAAADAPSINFVTCHDGFTLHDLVTYSRKHNDLNGEDNRRTARARTTRGTAGHEGETDDPVVNAVRDRQKRNILATLLLSVGTPMMSMGDELGRSQWGNNNAYCQDNELSVPGRLEPRRPQARAARLHEAAAAAARGPAGAAAAQLLPRSDARRLAGSRTSRGSGPTAKRWAPTTGTPRRRAVSAISSAAMPSRRASPMGARSPATRCSSS